MKNKLFTVFSAALIVVALAACQDILKKNNGDPDTPETTYTVTFNSNGGSSVANQTVVEGDRARRPADPQQKWLCF